MTDPAGTDGAVHISLDLWYPDCWEIETTERFDVGMLGYGIYTTGERVSTLFTLHADTQAAIDSAIDYIAEYPYVHAVSEMNPTYRHATTPVPGNAMRDLLVDHDGLAENVNAATLGMGNPGWPDRPSVPDASRGRWQAIRGHLDGFADVRAACVISDRNPAHVLANAPEEYPHVSGSPTRAGSREWEAPPPSRADRHADD